MKNTVSPRDLEMLSEYLDGRLDAGKRANLEARIKSNAELAETLNDLSQTRALLRSLPLLKAPRSFKLTPEMAGRREAPRIYPAFQFASVLASLLLVLVLAGDFLGLGRRSLAPAAAPLNAAQPPALEQTVDTFSAQSANGLQPQAATTAPQEDMTASSPMVGAGSIQATEEVSRSAAMSIQGTTTPTDTEKTGIQPTPVGPQAAYTNPEATQPAVALEQPPLSETAPQPQNLKASEPVETPTQPFPLPVLRIGEIMLALVALGTGLAAYFLRRGTGG